MPKARTIQTSFNSGILSPEVSARIDLDKYYRGAAVIDNAIVMPQGGVSKRPGFKKLVDLPIAKGIPEGREVKYSNVEPKLMTMQFSKTECYVICLLPNGNAFAVDAFTGRRYDIETLTSLVRIGTSISDIQYIQLADTIIMTHPYMIPTKIERLFVGGEIVFQMNAYEITHYPKSEFDTSQFDDRTIYDDQDITFDGLVNGDKFALSDSFNQHSMIAEITYQVDKTEFSDSTQNGEYIGDDATVMINELTQKLPHSNRKQFIYKANYKLINRIFYRKVDGVITPINVVERVFVNIQVETPLVVGETHRGLNRLICLGSSNGTVKVIPAIDRCLVKKPKEPTQSRVITKAATTTIQRLNLSHGNLGQSGSISFAIKLHDKTTLELRLTSSTGLNTFTDDIRHAIQGVRPTGKPTPYVKVSHRILSNTSYEFTIEFVGDAIGPWDLMTTVNHSGPITRADFTMIQQGSDGGTTNPDDPAPEDKENTWSEVRGYPSVVQVHDGRLVFAGSASKPQSIWFSAIGDMKVFDKTDPAADTLATDPISVTLSTPQLNPITGMISSRRLLVMTTGSTHTIQGEGDGVVTPTTVNSSTIGSHGSRLVQPVEMDSKVFYLQFQGASLNSTRFEFSQDSYTTSQAALLSPSVLVEPKAMDKVIGSNEFNTSYLAVLNGDGTIAYFNSLEEQGINNWTRFITKGKFVSITSINDQLYAISRRGETLSLEVMQPGNKHMDGYSESNLGQGISIIGGLDEFKGKSISLLADNYPMFVDVDANGFVELPFAANEVYAGDVLSMKLTTLPLNVQFKSGMILNSKKRIIGANVELLGALDVSVSYCERDYSISDRKMGFITKEPPKPLTGAHKLRFTGWTNKADLTIKSSLPVPATILSLEVEVKTKG